MTALRHPHIDDPRVEWLVNTLHQLGFNWLIDEDMPEPVATDWETQTVTTPPLEWPLQNLRIAYGVAHLVGGDGWAPGFVTPRQAGTGGGVVLDLGMMRRACVQRPRRR